MLQLLVIADDFTGALDTGVQFANYGIKTFVSTDMSLTGNLVPENIEVLVLNTESRHLTFEQAYNKIAMILKEAKIREIPFIYKKVDSALRGNVSAEIKALVDHCDQEIIPFLPAYPAMNRVLIDGHLYIDEVLVTKSVFAQDPYEPVTESNLIVRLEKEAQVEATLVHGTHLLADKKGVYVFDAQSDEMLHKQAESLQQKKLLKVTAGCAGFAKILANQLFPDRKEVPYVIKKPIVVICGSVNPITKMQISYAAKRNASRISLTADQLMDLDYWENDQGQEEIQGYLKQMFSHRLLVFETFSEKTTKEIQQYREEHGLSLKECRFRIGESLGRLTKALWSLHQENTFLFTGGDTLFQSMQVLGISGIKPITEMSPGIVLSAINWGNKEMQVITKSGGFGNEELLEEISLQ